MATGGGTDLNAIGYWQILVNIETNLLDLFSGYLQRNSIAKKTTPRCQRLIVSLGNALEVTADLFVPGFVFPPWLHHRTTIINSIYFGEFNYK